MNKCDYLVLLSHIQLIWANIQGVKNCFKIFLIYILPLLPTCWSRFYDSKRQKRSEGGQETKTILKLSFFGGGGGTPYIINIAVNIVKKIMMILPNWSQLMWIRVTRSIFHFRDWGISSQLCNSHTIRGDDICILYFLFVFVLGFGFAFKFVFVFVFPLVGVSLSNSWQCN